MTMKRRTELLNSVMAALLFGAICMAPASVFAEDSYYETLDLNEIVEVMPEDNDTKDPEAEESDNDAASDEKEGPVKDQVIPEPNHFSKSSVQGNNSETLPGQNGPEQEEEKGDGSVIESAAQLQNAIDGLGQNETVSYVFSKKFNGNFDELRFNSLKGAEIHLSTEEVLTLRGDLIMRDHTNVTLVFDGNIHLSGDIIMEDADYIDIKNLSMDKSIRGLGGDISPATVHTLKLSGCTFTNSDINLYYHTYGDMADYTIDNCYFTGTPAKVTDMIKVAGAWKNLEIRNSVFENVDVGRKNMIDTASTNSYNQKGRAFTVKNTEVKNCKGNNLFYLPDSTPKAFRYEAVFDHLTATGNTTNFGSDYDDSLGLVSAALYNTSSVLEIKNSYFYENTATSGVINVKGGTTYIDNTTVEKNNTNSDRTSTGGITVGIVNRKGVVYITESKFIGNLGDGWASAIDVNWLTDQKYDDALVSITDTEISGNKIKYDPTVGHSSCGAISIYYTHLNALKLNNVDFHGNYSQDPFLGRIYEDDVDAYNNMFSGKESKGSIPDEEFLNGQAHLLNNVDITYARQRAFAIYENQSGVYLSEGELPEPTLHHFIGDEITLPDPDFYRYGYEFAGWTTDQFGDTPEYAPGAPYVIPNYFNDFYTVWEKIETSYHINYFIQPDAAIPEKTMVYDFHENAAIDGTDAVREGFAFEGWTTTEDRTGEVVYNAGDQVRITEDLNLYAKWTPVPVTVSFDLNGGKGNAPEVQTLTHGEKAKPVSDPERAYYKFAGWSRFKDTKDLWDFSQAVYEDMVLYAYWETIDVPEPILKEIYVDGKATGAVTGPAELKMYLTDRKKFHTDVSVIDEIGSVDDNQIKLNVIHATDEGDQILLSTDNPDEVLDAKFSKPGVYYYYLEVVNTNENYSGRTVSEPVRSELIKIEVKQKDSGTSPTDSDEDSGDDGNDSSETSEQETDDWGQNDGEKSQSSQAIFNPQTGENNSVSILVAIVALSLFVVTRLIVKKGNMK